MMITSHTTRTLDIGPATTLYLTIQQKAVAEADCPADPGEEVTDGLKRIPLIVHDGPAESPDE